MNQDEAVNVNAPNPSDEEVKETEAQQEEQDAPSDKTQELAAEVEKMKDQVLRAMAESENTRRRLTKELADAKKYSVSTFAKEMLTVSDNFRRALGAVPSDKAQEEPTLKNLMGGVEATERQLIAALERFGITQIESPLEKQFDPHLHQVMMEQEDPSKPAGMVVQVLQEGYMIHGRLLREAMVVVTKGGAPAKKVDTEA